jgi:DHA1 family tetracycline resistance protein-like MFS transporter
MNLLSFLLNPVLGSLSDAHGRKPVILLSLAVSALPAAVLVALIQTPALRPVWYYAVNATGGPTYFLGVAFATLSDVFPRQKFRASSYGLLLACFYGGYALGPSLSLVLSSWGVASASFGLMMAAFWVAILFLPETLSTGVGVSSVRRTQGGEQQQPSPGRRRRCVTLLVRPFRELSILNRSPAIRLVALGSFFSSMVYASDVTLVVYYIIEQLNVRDADLAQMFLIMGAVGIVFQGGLLPSLIKRFGGEFRLLVATFACGVVHNTLYGLATGKRTILLALLLAQFTKLNFPILSSIASQMVSSREQGRMQGAMFATNALASAFGPLSMEYVYGKTKSRSPETWYGGGPGTMFFYAALLQVLGTVTVSCIPRSASRAVIPHDEPEPRRPQPDSSLEFEEEESLLATTAASDLAEPLLSANCVDPRVI